MDEDDTFKTKLMAGAVRSAAEVEIRAKSVQMVRSVSGSAIWRSSGPFLVGGLEHFLHFPIYWE